MNRRGITIVELVMVIGVVAILGAVAATQFGDFTDEAKATVTLSKMKIVHDAIAGNSTLNNSPGYRADNGTFPVTMDDLITKPVSARDYNQFLKLGWRGPYIKSVEAGWDKDAWGTRIVFIGPIAGKITIRSCGPDLICGGVNAADDLELTAR